MKSFPRGVSGIGLLVLRCTLAILIVSVTGRALYSGDARLADLAVTATALFVVLGLFTWSSSCIAGLLTVVYFGAFKSGAGFSAALPLTTIVLISLSLAMMGPGAYSLDAIFFGPRRITLPNR